MASRFFSCAPREWVTGTHALSMWVLYIFPSLDPHLVSKVRVHAAGDWGGLSVHMCTGGQWLSENLEVPAGSGGRAASGYSSPWSRRITGSRDCSGAWE
jgi:hypothetical protein